MQESNPSRLGQTLQKLESSGLSQDSILVKELKNRVQEFSKNYAVQLRDYHSKTFNTINEIDISRIAKQILYLNKKKEQLYHTIATQLAEFYKRYQKEMHDILKKKDLSREISENPSFSGNSNENTPHEPILGNSGKKPPRLSLENSLSNHTDLENTAPSFFNNPQFLNVTQQQNLEGVCMETYSKNQLSISPVKTTRLGLGKIITAVKEQSEHGQCIWAGGQKELMMLVRNMEQIVSVCRETSPLTITQIIRLKDVMLLMTDQGKILIMSLGGDLESEIHLKELFLEQESVSCHLTCSNSSVVLGMTSGRMIVVIYNSNDQSLCVTDKEEFHAAYVTSIIWENENKRIFLSSSVDHTINKCKLNSHEKIDILKKFKYDESVLCLKNFHGFVLVGMTNNTIALIEPERGIVVTAINDRKLKHSSKKYNPVSGYTSVSYMFKGSENELSKLSQHSLKDKKFLDILLQRTYFIGITNTAKLHILSSSSFEQQPELSEIDLFPDVQNAVNTNRLPVIAEKLESGLARFKVISSSATVLRDRSNIQASYISEVSIAFTAVGLQAQIPPQVQINPQQIIPRALIYQPPSHITTIQPNQFPPKYQSFDSSFYNREKKIAENQTEIITSENDLLKGSRSSRGYNKYPPHNPKETFQHSRIIDQDQKSSFNFSKSRIATFLLSQIQRQNFLWDNQAHSHSCQASVQQIYTRA